MSTDSLTDSQREMVILIEKHQELVAIMNDDYIEEKERQKALENAQCLADKIEKLVRAKKRQERISSRETSPSPPSSSIVPYDVKLESPKSQEDSAVKRNFLQMFNLEPRSVVEGKPMNRKSKRRPAPKLTDYYASALDRKFIVPMSKKRIVRKKLISRADVPRPSSVPPIVPSSIGSRTMPVNRFITETMVTCDACNEPFKIHHVTSHLTSCSVLEVPRICFVCQVSRNADQN